MSQASYIFLSSPNVYLQSVMCFETPPSQLSLIISIFKKTGDSAERPSQSDPHVAMVVRFRAEKLIQRHRLQAHSTSGGPGGGRAALLFHRAPLEEPVSSTKGGSAQLGRPHLFGDLSF